MATHDKPNPMGHDHWDRRMPSDLRSRLCTINERIAALELQRSSLRQERKNILEELAAVVYPVLTLPNEITSAIFLQYVDKDLMLYHPSGLRPSPLRLASVCRLWREVALSTSSLWTHLSSGSRGTGFGGGYNRPNVPHLLRFWLPRAGTLPLYLHMHLPPSPSTQSDEILRVLGEYSARWKSLEINSDGPVTFPAHIRGPFSSLTKFSIWIHPAPSSDGMTSVPVLQDAPCLREVGLDAVAFADWNIGIPWAQLTKLELLWYSVEDIVEILPQATNLEVFVTNSEYLGSVTHPPLFTPCVLPRLHTIDLGPGEFSSTVLNYLTLPSLEHFRAHTFHAACVEHLQSLVTRSNCSPRTIYMYLHEPDLEPVYEFITTLPSFREWRMAAPGAATEAFSVLFAALIVDPSTILPGLESFHIEDCRTGIALPGLVRMLAARSVEREGMAKLKSFALRFEEDMQNEHADNMKERDRDVESALARLGELRSQGLEVDIRSSFKWLSDNISLSMNLSSISDQASFAKIEFIS
ncbi:hypothetical protein DFH06DRAFT_1147963 [Mycena polygramma]|nr:hypothetical protein DFH06DRAFT_1147963 [Mycena polygramma]